MAGKAFALLFATLSLLEAVPQGVSARYLETPQLGLFGELREEIGKFSLASMASRASSRLGWVSGGLGSRD